MKTVCIILIVAAATWLCIGVAANVEQLQDTIKARNAQIERIVSNN